MLEDLPSIERLSLPTQTRLRSTQILTSLPQIVSELIQNSLDANANHIDIGLDCKEWMCSVSDDGCGISKDGLEILSQGEEGARYNTSKEYAPGFTNSISSFGFRGEAISSCADISCIEICTRTANSRTTWSIILKGGRALYQGPAVRWKRESHGTTVCIRDAFYNLPVRRLSHTSDSRTWEQIRREIETYALAFPHISFTLENKNESHYKDRVFHIHKSSSTLDAFRLLYGHALTECVEEINAVSGSMKLEGFISLIGATSKVYQFLYINNHHIRVSDLVRVIDSQFASSSFGKNALEDDGERHMPRATIRRSPRKVEKRPVYVLNLSMSPEDIDNCLDPTKSIIQLRNQSSVISFLSTTIKSFLRRHGFLNSDNDIPRQSTSPQPSSRKRKRIDIDDSGFAEHSSLAEGSFLTFGPRIPPALSQADLYASTDNVSEEIMWTDSSTGERFIVDSRTGNSFRCAGTRIRQMENKMSSTTHTTNEESRRTLTPKLNSAISEDSVPLWLEQALMANEAYATTEARIPSAKLPAVSGLVSRSGPFQHDKQECYMQRNSISRERLRPDNLQKSYNLSSYRLTREDIQRAEIINQVDRKFIACRIAKVRHDNALPNENGDVEPNSNFIIVLVDQHAADERIRVEELLKELFSGFLHSEDGMDASEIRGIRTRELNPPLPVLLTQHEALTIKESQDVQELLLKWGVEFAELDKLKPEVSTSESGSSLGYIQLLVRSIPRAVSDKLLQGDELRDFIKGFLAQIHSEELSTDINWDSPSKAGEDDLWIKAVRQCPKVLLDLINLKACRGAIMFNDPLSNDQCEKLLKRLSKTAFPFQCAHGRPSLVPIMETGTLSTLAVSRRISRKRWERLEIDLALF